MILKAKCCVLFLKGHLEKLLADKKLDAEKRKEYESVIGQVKIEMNNLKWWWNKININLFVQDWEKCRLLCLF